jgi:hypothetical protein
MWSQIRANSAGGLVFEPVTTQQLRQDNPIGPFETPTVTNTCS